MTRPQVHRLAASSAPAEHYHLPAAKRLAGNPEQTLWMQYTDTAGTFFAGLWHSEPATWKIAYTEQEYRHMLEGTRVVADADAHAVTLRAGDEAVIPRGFVGTWQVVDAATQRFVIHEPKA
jgi:uncharacterized protein